MKEKRDLNVMFAKSGSGSITSRLTIPIAWVKEMNITKDDRTVEVTFNEESKTITIKKK
ncbi:AbrB/MazE/SpoVT family DNA-binding domain-containing protein [Romboutsia ilealis]|uniref:AbrB/MazE/SpoVT family DNA-binding domain-containing protein n=1 Tax=Romboutsia faecis TaxID=2764597 RepID=A0ABR7JNX2_9FIRM|nr:AbrB/MazE/SpoVT family DNA-binding domain-containing protein [Romboutsia faecis]MBC5996457.1 AbrB/MazE/SpoVT family DNA-binding domain-containing protein [Romboutsia faecis]MRN26222.1 AbrB/MazE/SpoVT family DNA-binding domain-containing protein [Romboutsia ilealis]